MMASKSPYFLQALGEAGQAGIATLQEQRGKKGEKELTDAQIEKALSGGTYTKRVKKHFDFI